MSTAPSSDEGVNTGTGSGQADNVATATIGEVEVQPIIVGIEMEPEILTGSRINSDNRSGQPPAFMQGLMQMLNNPRGPTATVGSNAGRSQQSNTTTNASNPTSSSATGQDSQARSGGGAQTQSTTSTNTRSSAHVHVAPLGPMSFNIPSMMMPGQPSFDPLLPCNSHHTNPLNRRTRHPAAPQAPQRPRSASVPPRTANAAGREPGNRPQPTTSEANSARSSPAHRRPMQRNFDFEITAHADIMPMIMTPQGMVSIGTPRRMMPPPPAPGRAANSQSSANGSQDRMEPSLAQLLTALQGEANGGDAGMLNVVMGVMSEINGNSNRTVSEFLERIPDYNYTEGESLVTDLLMLIARNTSFSDLVNIFQGSSDLNHLQTPLRYSGFFVVLHETFVNYFKLAGNSFEGMSSRLPTTTKSTI